MKYKIDNKYIVDAKSPAHAIKVVNVVKQTRTCDSIETIAKTYNHNVEKTSEGYICKLNDNAKFDMTKAVKLQCALQAKGYNAKVTAPNVCVYDSKVKDYYEVKPGAMFKSGQTFHGNETYIKVMNVKEGIVTYNEIVRQPNGQYTAFHPWDKSLDYFKRMLSEREFRPVSSLYDSKCKDESFNKGDRVLQIAQNTKGTVEKILPDGMLYIRWDDYIVSYNGNHEIAGAYNPNQVRLKKLTDSKCKDSRITPDELRRFCIKNNYYTSGTIEDYNNLLMNCSKWNWREIAEDIAEHTRGVWSTDVWTKLRQTFGDSIKDATDYVIAYKIEGNADKESIKANSAEEAIKSFGKMAAIRGWGTRNVNIISISPNDGNMRLYGTLSTLLSAIGDSVKDSDIESLSKEEEQAIDDYKKAIANTKDPKLLNLYAHILREEIEHLEELQNEELVDSVKDSYLIQLKEDKDMYWQEDDHFGRSKQYAKRFNSYEEAKAKANAAVSGWPFVVNIIADSCKAKDGASSFTLWCNLDSDPNAELRKFAGKHYNDYFSSGCKKVNSEFTSLREAVNYALDHAEKWEYACAVKYTTQTDNERISWSGSISAKKGTTIWLICGWIPE